MTLPTFPPLSMSPIETTPPFALALAMPPLPALAEPPLPEAVHHPPTQVL